MGGSGRKRPAKLSCFLSVVLCLWTDLCGVTGGGCPRALTVVAAAKGSNAVPSSGGEKAWEALEVDGSSVPFRGFFAFSSAQTEKVPGCQEHDTEQSLFVIGAGSGRVCVAM